MHTVANIKNLKNEKCKNVVFKILQQIRIFLSFSFGNCYAL